MHILAYIRAAGVILILVAAMIFASSPERIRQARATSGGENCTCEKTATKACP